MQRRALPPSGAQGGSARLHPAVGSKPHRGSMGIDKQTDTGQRAWVRFPAFSLALKSKKKLLISAGSPGCADVCGGLSFARAQREEAQENQDDEEEGSNVPF